MYKQLFYVTSANNSPNLLLSDGCYTLSVIKPCYSVELTVNSSKFQGNPEMVPTQLTVALEKAKLHVGSSIIVEMKKLRCLNGLIPKTQHQEG